MRCLCDNAAVVAVVNSGSSKCEKVMHLMRSLFFLAVQQDITLVAQHIPGVENREADAMTIFSSLPRTRGHRGRRQ